MSIISANEVKIFIFNCIDYFEENNLKLEDIPDDFDLLEEGVIDSFGIIVMITSLEEHFGIKIDLEKLDAEDFTIIGPLSRHVEQQSINNE